MVNKPGVWREATGRLCGTLSFLSLLSAAAVLLWGGYSIGHGVFKLASHNVARDLVIAIGAGLVEFVLCPETVERRSTRLLHGMERLAPLIAGAASIVVLAVGLGAGTYCACGSDSYGYVSEAVLWTNGSLHVRQPIASHVHWRYGAQAFVPLAYQPVDAYGTLVPTCPPGLPLLMAAAMKVGRSPSAAFVVVPLLGAVAVWSTFLLGRRFGGSLTGLWSALLLACSATFIFQVVQPMSDVPVTAWWLVAMVLLLQEADAAALLAGLASSWAVLTRPNLVPLVPICLLLLWWRGAAGGASEKVAAGTARRRRLVLFCLGALPGPLILAWIQSALYGSPLRTGYGSFGELFALRNIRLNVWLYPKWLWQTHGPFIFVGLVSPVVWACRRWFPSRSAAVPGHPAPSTDAFVAFALAFTAVLFSEYLWYIVFDSWAFTRFLLPSIPLLLLLGVWTITNAARAARSATALVSAMVLFAFVAIDFLRHGVDHHVLLARNGERRYIEAARYAAAISAPDVLVLAMQHSGSMRYHGGRGTVRYDWLHAGELDRAILDLHEMNRGPLLVLDDWEELDFKLRFRGQRWGALDWPPRAEFETQPPTRVYDPFDRDRYVAHQPVRTMHFRESR